MTNQTLDYISLKPLADRFRVVADSITDEEIGQIIRQEIREKIREQLEFDSSPVMHLEEIINEWFDNPNNYDYCVETLKESITDKLIEKKKVW